MLQRERKLLCYVYGWYIFSLYQISPHPPTIDLLLLTTFYVPGTVLGLEDTLVNKTHEIPILMESAF